MDKYEKEMFLNQMRKILVIIKEIREFDDFCMLEQNEIEVKQWYETLLKAEEEEELRKLFTHIKERVYYCFFDRYNDSEIDEKRCDELVELVDISYRYW